MSEQAPAEYPEVTIVIPIYITDNLNERLRWLQTAVESAAKQRYPNFRIELWNDGSPSPRVMQTIKRLARRFHCDAFECTREGHNTAGWIMNTTLDHCETPFVFWMGCDDELHLGYLMACMMAWYTRAHEEGIKALGATTNCIKETRVNGEVFRQEFPMASSPVYPVDLIRQYKYDEKISHGIDGGFQKHFIDQGYTFLKVEMPMYLYRFHEDQLSRGIHYDQDVKDLEELSPELGMTLIKDIQDTKKQVMNRDSRRKKNR